MAQAGLPACRGLHAREQMACRGTAVFPWRPLIAFASRNPLEHSVMRVRSPSGDKEPPMWARG